MDTELYEIVREQGLKIKALEHALMIRDGGIPRTPDPTGYLDRNYTEKVVG